MTAPSDKPVEHRNCPVAKAANEPPIPSQEKLLEAAIEEFAEQGMTGARTDKIARRAGVNKQLIYHYFGNKDGLYLAALRRVYLRFRGDPVRLAGAIEAVDAVTAVRQLACYLFNQQAELMQFRRLVQDANFHGMWTEENFSDIRDAFRVLIDTFAEVIARGVAEGVFHPDVEATELYLSIAGACSIRLNNPHSLSYVFDIDLISSEGAQRSLQIAIDNIVAGLRPDAMAG